MVVTIMTSARVLLGALFLVEVAFTDGKEPTCTDCDQVKIPLEMALRLNTITDENQLIREFVARPSVDNVEAPFVKSRRKPVLFSPDSVSFRIGSGEEAPVERKEGVTIPKPASCIPELQSVSLRQSHDPWLVYWPTCTRVERCGGCCSHQLLSCQAIETELVNFQVVVSEYIGNRLKLKGKELVAVEKHTKCKCDCTIKEQDCNEHQEYRKGECRCVCKDRDAEVKCNNDNQIMHWDPISCSCTCREPKECSTGTFFSESTCSCQPTSEESFTNPFEYNVEEEYLSTINSTKKITRPNFFTSYSINSKK